jgi:hypothetical protein
MVFLYSLFPFFRDIPFIISVFYLLLIKFFYHLFTQFFLYIDKKIKVIYFKKYNKKDEKIKNVNNSIKEEKNKKNRAYSATVLAISSDTREDMLKLGLDLSKYDSALKKLDEYDGESKGTKKYKNMVSDVRFKLLHDLYIEKTYLISQVEKREKKEKF